MMRLIAIHDRVLAAVDRAGDLVLPVAARLVFAATLLVYYWSSAQTKLGDGLLGLFHPSAGAYAQILPRQFEAVGYDVAQMSTLQWLIVVAGTWAEFLLPALIVLGLATRLAALGMIGFVLLQSLTDVFGHGATDPATLGAWFDAAPDGVILDQRLFWVFVLAVLVARGAGALSVDAVLQRRLVAAPA